MSRKMKDSGVEWIGEIPEAWEVTKVKNAITSLLSGSTPDSNNEDYYCDYATGIPWITISDMSNMDYISHTKKTITMEAFESNNLSLLPIGTLIYSIYASLGNVSELSIDATTNQAILGMIIDEKKIYKKYLKFWLKSTQANISYYMNSNTQNNLNANIVKNLPLVFPCIDIQQKIATYLDQKVAEIDHIISKTQASIEEYKRYKQSIITEAVTKGLDPNVPMKDSGIEWIGEIPEHWSKVRLKDFFNFEKGTNAAMYTQEYIGLNPGEYPVYSGQTENNGIMGLINSFDYDIDECLFTTTVGAKVMTPRILRGKFSLSQNCLIMTKTQQQDIRFFYYSLFPLFDFEKSLVPTYMQPSLRMSDLNRYQIYKPNYNQQQKIANFLDKKVAKIDHIISKKEQLINNLESYKKSLIYEVVTGKKEVM